MVVERDVLPDDLVPEVGMGLQGESPDGNVANMIVVEVTDTTFTVDANHPLAGDVLNFDIELVEIL